MTAPQQAPMSAAEFNEAQAAITAEAAAAIYAQLQQFQGVALTPAHWQVILDAIYETVARYREQSAELGREFYDSQREYHVGETKDAYLAEYERSWFREAMNPAYKYFSHQDASPDALANVVSRAVKEVENGGRRTILRAVREDPVAVGWARVATGRETCGFCMMLVSRGPVYISAQSAGLSTDDETAAELFRRGDDRALDELTTRWHPNCDCKIVPVFDVNLWPGRDAYLRARKLWNEATRGYTGRDAINAMRRAVEDDDVNPGDFAAVA